MQIHRYVLDDHGVKTRITQKELTNLKISNPTLDKSWLPMRTIQLPRCRLIIPQKMNCEVCRDMLE